MNKYFTNYFDMFCFLNHKYDYMPSDSIAHPKLFNEVKEIVQEIHLLKWCEKQNTQRTTPSNILMVRFEIYIFCITNVMYFTSELTPVS